MKKIILVLLSLLLLVTTFAGCSMSGPSKSQLEEDAQNYIDKRPAVDDVIINKLEIEFSDCKDDFYEAQITVYCDYTNTISLESKSNDITLYVEYKHYDNGGWKLMDIDTVD